MSPGRSQQRLQEEIRRELAAIVEFESRDPVVVGSFPTVMDVRLSSDARYAKVYVASGTEIDREELLTALARDKGFYRSELAQRLSLRHTPDLQFVVDETVENALRLGRLLQEDDDELAANPQ